MPTIAKKINNQALLQELQHKAREVLDRLIPDHANIVLLDYPNTTNVGDSLIWLGEIAYLSSRKLNIRYVCDVENYHLATLKKVLDKKTIVLMHGGGNFGTVWKKIHDFRLKVLSDLPDIPIIQLPQTIYFDEALKIAEMRDAIQKQGNYTLLARSQPSYEFAKKSFDTAIYLCPDMAFFIGPVDQQHPIKVDRYILARTDVESSGELAHYPVSLGKNVRYEIDDWLEPSLLERLIYKGEMYSALWRKWLDPNNRLLMIIWNFLSYQRLRRGVRLLSRGKIVITDRLHAHILSILMGKTNILIDNNYGKLKVFYQTWTFNCHYAKLVGDSANIESAIQEFATPSLNVSVDR